MPSSLRPLPPVNDSRPSLEELSTMFTGGVHEVLQRIGNASPKFPPLQELPCANGNAAKYFTCEKQGKQACSSCKLVSYCSKECQKSHWARHKSACKDPLKSVNWQPGWLRESRVPRFLVDPMASGDAFTSMTQDRFSLGQSLWGNVPAMDIVNLPKNEKDLKTDLTLAFAASGDIRNVIATVNALGSDYSGRVKICLNDMNPHIVARNIALLLILGTLQDEVLAADIALHFWYSVFLPAEYRLRIQSMVLSLLVGSDPSGPVVAPLGPHSTLTCLVSNVVRILMMKETGADDSMSPMQAQDEYQRVRCAPSREDYRDRMYMGLRPSHRVAFQEYRRFGIILPFGAFNAHFNVPNTSLFSNGGWLQTDYADPLESWDVDEVFSAGKAHGAQPEDVYGCLYFYLTDQLRAFARHLRQHRITFHVFSTEACSLAQDIVEGNFAELGIPPTIRFNRVDVSNIMDENYAGIHDVMNSWGPLLAKSDNAAITGYFMNWAVFAREARIMDADRSALSDALALMKRSNRLQVTDDPMFTLRLAMDDVEIFRDNSKEFTKYWKSHSGTNATLKPRTVHKIIPHRLKIAINAKPEALPDLADDETWYRHTRLLNRTWTERFVELCHCKL